jgi:hypothetical protein
MAFIGRERTSPDGHPQNTGEFGLPMSRGDRLLDRLPKVARFRGEWFRA